jgi:cytochrome c biogenesis protein
MTASTAGVELNFASRALRDAAELLSSMRFAISLLAVICIASVIGTVVQQNQPAINYVNQFGPFWSELFAVLGLPSVYSTPWFLLILAFLVVSVSLCIVRNAPKILADLRTYKEQVREQSLTAFRHKARGHLPMARDTALQQVSALLTQGGWKAKAQVRDNGVMIAARKGAANKIGYLAAHSAIVLICLGGLSDGDLIVRAQMALLGKQAYSGSGLVRDVGAQHRLSPNNPTFRGNLFVPEGQRASTAMINIRNGVVLQDLPFDVELKKFIVEYYATGMPKLFASQIVIHDHETKQAIAATVKVNEPAYHRGVAIYQSSFDDGGSALTLRAHPIGRPGEAFDIKGEVGGAPVALNRVGSNEKLQIELSGLRVINVENLSAPGQDKATDVRAVNLVQSLEEHLGSGAKVRERKDLRNVGPSVSYKLRGSDGQAVEYQNYMLPIELDGQRVFLAGLRETPDQAFQYLRIPADDQGSMDDWLRLRAALADAALRERAVDRFVAQAAPKDKSELAAQLRTSALTGLSLFAGAEVPAAGEQPTGGLLALQQFLDSKVPAADRSRTSEVVLRIVNGSLFELLNVARESAGLAPQPANERTQAFMTQAVLAISDSFAYPAPLLFTLKDFQQVQASVFQVTRAPGKTVVYLGCLLLIIGVFAMLYVRERRLWVWLAGPEQATGTTELTMALSSTRQTMDTDREFDALKQALLGHSVPVPAPAAKALETTA